MPFTLEKVTVLLQMHIMEKAPYKTLWHYNWESDSQ